MHCLPLPLGTRMLGKQVFCSLVLLALLAFQHGSADTRSGFVETEATDFLKNGHPFNPNGFNAYWMMVVASDPSGSSKVTSALEQASDLGMNVARTWAFSDGGYKPLQYSPGFYDENMFKGLDFVISEAKKYGVYLILSLVNNHGDFGGKRQYVEWAREQGQFLSSDDDFYMNDVVKGFYKKHVKTVLTRINTITGVAYKDDPIIFAWELMNEPRCDSDLSGQTLQLWITEMAAHVKSIDSNHLLEVGLEGFYGESMPQRMRLNPIPYDGGTDFIANNKIKNIDFTTIHAYPDQWIASKNEQDQVAFLRSWIRSHSHDSGAVLGKPLLITEFGSSSKFSDCSSGERDAIYGTVYNEVFQSARVSGACVGALFWQLLEPGMDQLRDGYEIVLSECPSAAYFISLQSHSISEIPSSVSTRSSNR